VLAGLIAVTPVDGKVMADDGKPRAAWKFEGYSRFEGVLAGGLISKSAPFVIEHDKTPESARAVKVQGEQRIVEPVADGSRVKFMKPISGSSDADLGKLNGHRDREMAPLYAPERHGRLGGSA
jgi:hypothetical protein